MSDAAAVSPPARPLLRGWLHLAMLPVAVAGAAVLITGVAGGPGDLSVLVFSLCLVGLYTTSSLYHVPRWSTRTRAILARCDVAMIQLFIAGTFTPIAYHALSGSWRTWSLAGAWAVALVGAAVAASPIRAPRWVGAASYMAFGWLLVVPLGQVFTALSPMGASLIALGGVLYTLGALVYTKRRPDPFPRWFGYHEVFHLLVIAATTAHYFALWQYVLPVGA